MLHLANQQNVRASGIAATRIAVFVDYENFVISYKEHHKLKRKSDVKVWGNLAQNLLFHYARRFSNYKGERFACCGIFVCVGMPDIVEKKDPVLKLKEHFQRLDRKPGFVVRYGMKSHGKEKGVDTEIVCQMLMGAVLNHFDACILMSDDNDYLPVVRRLQDYFGKRVIQAGFLNTSIRNQSFGNIQLELMDRTLRNRMKPAPKPRKLENNDKGEPTSNS